MRRTNKKGFTIVELVIVIAVIAILAAVLIPTFASIVKKANLSADEQAVRQMNTALAMYTAENNKPETSGEVKTALYANGINTDTMTPVTQGYAFYWDKGENKIVLVGADKATPESDWVLLTTTGYGTLKEVDSKDAFTSAISDTGTDSTPVLLKLTSDLNVSADKTKSGNEIVIGANQTVIVDLNGKTLTTNNRFLVKDGGSLTVKNGKVSSSERAFKNVGGNLTLENVDVTVTGDPLNNGAAIFVIGISDTSIVNCNISTTHGYALATNSSANENDGARISIIGGSISTTADGYAGICINIGSSVVVDGCKVSGIKAGGWFRGCNATIKNATFTHSADAKNTKWEANGVAGAAADLVLASGGNKTSGFDGYLSTAKYVCENVTADTVVVHQPEGGNVTVSGDIEIDHTCNLESGKTCGTDDEWGKTVSD